jgi:hypothetical protein
LSLATGSDPGFELAAKAADGLEVKPGAGATVAVIFRPNSVNVPLARGGTLIVESNHPTRPRAEIALAGRIRSDCRLSVSPEAITFDQVSARNPRVAARSASLTLANVGNVICAIGQVEIRKGSDPEFSLVPQQADAFTLVPRETRSIMVQFDRGAPSEPGPRTGQLAFQTTDASQALRVVPLSALLVAVDCSLSIAPANLDFGNVRFRSTPKANLTLSNQGGDPCPISGVALGPETDSAFTLGDGQPLAFPVDPGATQTLVVRFAAFDSTAQHLKTGTLNFRTGDLRMPEVTVPLAAYVNLTCVESSEWLYTVGRNSMLSRFDPTTATFTDIGQFTCPGSSESNSMAVDQSGGIWVSDPKGKLFKVDAKTLLCEAARFDDKQHIQSGYGMGFVFDRATGIDTLYIAGASVDTTTLHYDLVAVSLPSLSQTLVGPTEGYPELSGAGDGTLWGFFPYHVSPTKTTTLVRLDPKTGATLERFSYPTLNEGGNWAMKFWGGSFWLFLGSSIYRVDRTDPKTVHTVIANGSRHIVGAGVSTCAPLL